MFYRMVSSVSGQPQLTVYVIHSLPCLMSVIQIFLEDKMVMVGHLVTHDTIGYEKKLGLATGYDGQDPWRAILLKDNGGDVAIVLARWVGFIAGRAGVAGTQGTYYYLL
jgi:hypothetical protein